MKRISIPTVVHILGVMISLSMIAPTVHAKDTDAPWIEDFGAIAIQDPGGRTMPLDTYARLLAVELTGRSRWSEKRGPEGFADRHHLQLMCDLMFNGEHMIHTPLIVVENRPLKKKLGLDPETKFFAAMDLASNAELNRYVAEIQIKSKESDFQANREERLIIDIQNKLGTVSRFVEGKTIRIVPNGDSETFLDVGNSPMATAPANVQQAFANFGAVYRSNTNIDAGVKDLKAALASSGTISEELTTRINLEILYNNHKPWLWSALFYGLSIVAFGLSHITLRRSLNTLGWLLLVGGVVEQCFGIYLRVVILERPPVSNTYESILWMGLVAMAIAFIAQNDESRAWYIIGGLIAAELCVLFSMLVPLQDQTNAIPPVLRSNYWLIVHVLTIVASYGVLALCAVLAHVYLFRSILFARKSEDHKPMGSPIIGQVYRTMQIGVFLLTAGTILGGVWAADSWGRFWGWDPKETWALISIVIYVALLHGRYVGWLKDFGLAVASIVGFMSIVWTFYGVNYVMASGLHSYGFGSGGEMWVGLWALAEIALLVTCKIRHAQLLKVARERRHVKHTTSESTASDNAEPQTT